MVLMATLLGAVAAITTIVATIHLQFFLPGMLHESGKAMDKKILIHTAVPHPVSVGQAEFQRFAKEIHAALTRLEDKIDRIKK
jgi:hypothetical protein